MDQESLTFFLSEALPPEVLLLVIPAASVLLGIYLIWGMAIWLSVCWRRSFLEKEELHVGFFMRREDPVLVMSGGISRELALALLITFLWLFLWLRLKGEGGPSPGEKEPIPASYSPVTKLVFKARHQVIGADVADSPPLKKIA